MSASIFFDNKELKALRNLLNNLDLDTKDTQAEFAVEDLEDDDTLEELKIYITETYKTPFPIPERPDLTVIGNTYTYAIDDGDQEFTVWGSETQARNY